MKNNRKRLLFTLSIVLTLLLLSVLYFNGNEHDNNIVDSIKTSYSIEVIDDNKLIDKFIEGAFCLHKIGGGASLEELTEQLANLTEPTKLNLQPVNTLNSDYSEIRKSVLSLGLIYRNGDNPQIYSNIACAYVLNSDGVCATNHHIFDVMAKAREGSILMAAMDYQGNVFPIEEILCAREKDDIAIFKIDKGDIELKAVGLSNEPAKIGEDISLISHPMKRFYQYSKGCVTRYYNHLDSKTLRMGTDVNFAQGSSGAPLFNKDGQVIGMVASTIPLIAGQYNIQQMVIYETIPVSSIRRMIDLD